MGPERMLAASPQKNTHMSLLLYTDRRTDGQTDSLRFLLFFSSTFTGLQKGKETWPRNSQRFSFGERRQTGDASKLILKAVATTTAAAAVIVIVIQY